MQSAELKAALSIDQAQLDRWIREGLPHSKRGRRREFDGDQVAAWLMANGYAEAPAEILRTQREVARYRGVSERTVATWRSEGMASPPLTTEEVDGWCANNGKGEAGQPSAQRADVDLQRRKIAATVELTELKVGREKQQLALATRDLIPRGEAHAALVRIAAAVRNAGEQLERQFGADARAILDAALDQAGREIEDTFGTAHG